jgi:hypothetical protein
MLPKKKEKKKKRKSSETKLYILLIFLSVPFQLAPIFFFARQNKTHTEIKKKYEEENIERVKAVFHLFVI